MSDFSRADLHVHSIYSQQPTKWFLRKIGCYESYTPPLQVYKMARQRGMDFVTITDHDVIDGALEIAHLKGAFVSEEVTTRFPEDDCVIHVVTLDISESQHREIQKYKDNIFELVDYLYSQDIFHFVAHPLFNLNGKLTPEHLEKLLCLFKCLEVKNGLKETYPPGVLENIIAGLNQESLEHLANKHGIEPLGKEPWKKFMVGGSDDHGGLYVARAHTACPKVEKVANFLDCLRQGESEAQGCEGTAMAMAHTLYQVARRYYQKSPSQPGNILTPFLISLSKKAGFPLGGSFLFSWLGRQGSNLNILHFLKRLGKELDSLSRSKEEERSRQLDEKIYYLVNRFSGQLLSRGGKSLSKNLASLEIDKAFRDSRKLVVASSLLALYFTAYAHQNQERQIIDEVIKNSQRWMNSSLFADKGSSPKWTPSPFPLPSGERIKVRGNGVAFFTDTFQEINGVSAGLKEIITWGRKQEKSLTVISCSENKSYFTDYEFHFQALFNFPLPEYPELALNLPPVLDVLRFCERKKFSLFHICTPGPVGLMGLLLSKILHVPVVGTYHTQIPEYIRYLTKNEEIETWAWKYMRWFYQQMSTVYVPSRSLMNHLIAKGFPRERLIVPWQGVDIRNFHPHKRDPGLWSNYGLDGATKLLYVGRISREKDLDILAESFKGLKGDTEATLILVGDGPYKKELMKKLAGHKVLFTGYRQGEELAKLYASADIFVFPSTTDTFGRVVLEAQASGLPVIVSDEGGPQENIQAGETGLIVPRKDILALRKTLQHLLNNPQERKAMGLKARKFAETRDIETILPGLFPSS